MENNKDFNFNQVAGRKLKENLSINDGTPLISIATPYYNCKEYIKQTAYSILNQTFPYWEWIIVNDGSNEEGTKEILKEIENMDKRIKVYHQENKGRLEARDNAVKYTMTDLVLPLDADDTIDETFLECAYWTMKTNPKATWAYSDLITFEGENFLWKKIFDCEQEKTENIMPVCAVIRKQAIFDVGGYAAVDKDVHEDWHMWLRMIEKGYYPVRMNYYGVWYRKKKEGGVLSSITKNKEKQRHAEQEIKKQAKKIKKNVAALQYPMSTNFDYDSYPYIFDWNRKPINKKGEKINLLFIFPWLKIGGADKFNLDLISNLDQNKYNITILTTEPSDYVWRQKFEEYATVFDLTSFLHIRDWSAFMHYIIKSRNIDIVFQSNSFYGYYVLPWLKSQFPEVTFLDYVHNEIWGWRNGDYPRESTALAKIVDKTYTCNNHVKNVMYEKMGRKTHNVETVYIGVDTEKFDEDNVKIEDYPEVIKYKEKYEGKDVILFCARLSEEKRPLLAIKIFEKLHVNNPNTMLFVVGPGTMETDMKKLVNKLGLENYVIFFGSQEDTRPFYKLSKAILICSLTEGLTLTTYESLAMSTPVVTADVGGQKELVDDSCGAVVQNIQTSRELKNTEYSQEEIDRYAEAISNILNNSNYEKMKKDCRKKILNGFTIKNMIEKFDREFETMAKEKSHVDKNISDNEELYRQYLVIYNQLNQKDYFPDKGGYDVEGKIYDASMQRFRDRMWQKPMWRAFIGFLHNTGLMKFAKKKGLDKKIKSIVVDKSK